MAGPFTAGPFTVGPLMAGPITAIKRVPMAVKALLLCLP